MTSDVVAAATRALKGAAEQSLIMAGGAKVLRAQNRGRAFILAYHDVIPDGEGPTGERMLHLPMSEFCVQLDSLEQTHAILSLDQLLDGMRPVGRPGAVLTFDDAYRGALTVALPEFARRGWLRPCSWHPACSGRPDVGGILSRIRILARSKTQSAR